MRNIGALEEIEEIQIVAHPNTGAWREKDRIYPADWNIQILTNKRTRQVLNYIQKRRGGKILNMSTEGIAYRMHGSVETVLGDRLLVQLDRCDSGMALMQYKAVIEVVRICTEDMICARFVNMPWDLFNAIESDISL